MGKTYLSKTSAGRESILPFGAGFNALAAYASFVRYGTHGAVLYMAITPGGLEEAIFLP